MTWAEIMEAWTVFIRWVRRQMPGERVEYVASKEEGSEHGMKHLHVILTGWQWIDYDEIRAAWERVTGATNVNIKRTHGQTDWGAIQYATKYVTKALGQSNGKVVRRITYSQGWRRLDRVAMLLLGIQWHVERVRAELDKLSAWTERGYLWRDTQSDGGLCGCWGSAVEWLIPLGEGVRESQHWDDFQLWQRWRRLDSERLYDGAEGRSKHGKRSRIADIH